MCVASLIGDVLLCGVSRDTDVVRETRTYENVSIVLATHDLHINMNEMAFILQK